MDKFLNPTYFINSDSDFVKKTANTIISNGVNKREKAIKLFYWTRDEIKYETHSSFSSIRRRYKASAIIEKGQGWCVQKAVVLAALARAVDIPARLHFADIQNHQTPEKMIGKMGTNIFLYHGYTDLYIDGKWVKATPAFNKELCTKFGYKAVEFDGIHDAIPVSYTHLTLPTTPYV